MRKSSRKNKMSTAKLGVMFIVAAMALAGVGAGYSAWFDTITVTGTVNTGDVDLEIMFLSSTYVYKDTITDDCVELYELADLNGNPYRQFVYGLWRPDQAPFWTPPADFILVASSVATKTADDEVTVIANDLFPCITFGVDILLHYDGSIPVRINDAEIGTDDAWLQTLIDNGEAGVSVWESNEYGNLIVEIPLDEVLGYQIHYCEWIMVLMGIHLPQEDALMGQTASFTGKLEVVQWNEYPYEGGECGEEPTIGLHADVSLCMDRSGSITSPTDYSGTYRTAAKAFVDAVLTPDDGMVALSSFATTGSGDNALTKDGATLKGLIDAMSFGGRTNLKEGIQYAHGYLTTEPDGRDDDSNYPDFMVIITDGHPNEPNGDPEQDAIDAADAAKADGITVIVLGIGTGVNGVWLEDNIASAGYYYEGDWSDLETFLLDLVT